MPLILFGSAMLMKLMERFPQFIVIGAGLLGYVAGDMAVGDLAVKGYIDTHVHFLENARTDRRCAVRRDRRQDAGAQEARASPPNPR